MVAPGFLVFGILALPGIHGQSIDALEPREFDLNVPQLFIDSYWVERRSNEKGSVAAVPYVFHPPQRSRRPLLSLGADKPWEDGGLRSFSVIYDAEADRFRLYYEVENLRRGDPGYPQGKSLVAYAESEDGLHWEKPLYDIIAWGNLAKTNLVLQGIHEARFPHVQINEGGKGNTPRNLGGLPGWCFRGNRFLCFFRDDGHYLATSEDGIRWQTDPVPVLPESVGSYQTLVYDKKRKEFATYARSRIVYEHPEPFGKEVYIGLLARLSHPDLWSLRERRIQTVQLPGKGEKGHLRNLKVFTHHDLFWGMAEQFYEEPPRIELELALSRDGLHWEYPQGRPVLLPVGEAKSWDSAMVFGADRMIETGDAWWLYYAGWNGFLDDPNRSGGIGLARFEKERLVSIHADESGLTSYLETPPMVWPGGSLVLNVDAGGGTLEVQVTNADGKPIEGFSYEESEPVQTNHQRHVVRWKEGEMGTLENETIRLEFRFKNAEIFAFLAQD